MRGRSHYWRSPCRISRSTRICSWNSHLGLKMSGADLALSRAWRVGWLTVPLTGSAIVSDGMLLDMGPSRWSCRDPFRTSFANWPKRTFNQCHIVPSPRASKSGRRSSALRPSMNKPKSRGVALRCENASVSKSTRALSHYGPRRPHGSFHTASPAPESGRSTKCVGCYSGCLLHVWKGTTPIHRLDKSCAPSLTCVPPRPARHLEIAQ